LPDVQLPLPTTEYASNIYWVYGLVIGDTHPFDAEAFARRLSAEQIGTRPFFWPMHEQPVFKKRGLFKNVRCPVAERLARRGLYIPSGSGLGLEQVDFVADRVRNLFSSGSVV